MVNDNKLVFAVISMSHDAKSQRALVHLDLYNPDGSFMGDAIPVESDPGAAGEPFLSVAKQADVLKKIVEGDDSLVRPYNPSKM